MKSSVEIMSEDLARFYDDPLGFVMWAFPWAVEGGQLSGHTGPRPWQDKYLRLVGKRVKEHAFVILYRLALRQVMVRENLA